MGCPQYKVGPTFGVHRWVLFAVDRCVGVSARCQLDTPESASMFGSAPKPSTSTSTSTSTPPAGRLSISARYDRPMVFARITVDVERMGGVPCVRDLRFPVASIVAMLADGMTNDEILAEHPDLEDLDIVESLKFAALAVQERELPLRLPA